LGAATLRIYQWPQKIDVDFRGSLLPTGCYYWHRANGLVVRRILSARFDRQGEGFSYMYKEVEFIDSFACL